MKPDTPASALKEADFAEALGERYLSYALSTIMARSLPDVRDGLKPVHRRLLFAMRELGLNPASSYKKAARVVGDVIGKFHPHGDQAVYEALVRLAQDFAVRYPLIDGQGNFGNIDGDNAAAMRYTEARLTQVAEMLMAGLDQDAVDLKATYDGEGLEPIVLPSAFPNLLANGATGIAVGMATSIPPHNVAELCDALRHLIAKPEAPVVELLSFVQGPDFPTGGVLVESRESIRQSYETGRGSFRLRAHWQVEQLKSGTWQIVVDEIPYQVQKSRLIERIAELLSLKKLMLLADIRDESTDVVRMVLEPKSRNVDPAVLMESLFRQTDLETKFSLNLNVLASDGTPRVMALKEALTEFLAHRHEVLIRRSNHRRAAITKRLEVLEGYIVAFLNLDEVIRIIREEDEPKPALIARFELSDAQAEAILNMRLRSLRRLEEMELRKEHAELAAEKDEIDAMLADPKKRWKLLDYEIKEIRKRFGPDTLLGRRRTRIGSVPSLVAVPVEALVEREAITVLLSEKGWIRAVKGHEVDAAETKFKDGDGAFATLKAETTDKLLVFATDGRFFTISADKLPRGRGFGEPLRLSIDLANDQQIVAFRVHRPGGRLIVASSDGRGFVVAEDDAIAQTRAGKQILTPGEGARASYCVPVTASHIATIGDNRKILIFPVEQLPAMAKGRGVMLQRFKDGGLADLCAFDTSKGMVFPFGGNGRTRTVTDLTPWLGDRASAGRLAPPGFPRSNRFE